MSGKRFSCSTLGSSCHTVRSVFLCVFWAKWEPSVFYYIRSSAVPVFVGFHSIYSKQLDNCINKLFTSSCFLLFRVFVRSLMKMAANNAVLNRLEQKGAEADQVIEYLKQQVALLKEKASKESLTISPTNLCFLPTFHIKFVFIWNQWVLNVL